MNEGDQASPTWLDLYDYRHRVADMYRTRAAALTAGEADLAVAARFREQKNALFATHPQSAIPKERRRGFTGLIYFAYNPSFRVEATLEPIEGDEESASNAASPNDTPLRRAATVTFILEDTSIRLMVFWIDVYGGGLFLPFRDTTSSVETYGGGRYLFDTVKGSDFLRIPTGDSSAPSATSQGYAGGPIILDFNYAYNPSCAYDPRWVCPLAPRENWLSIAVRAGEKQYHE
jgi:uncharacterized protein (DUF1684 family)